MKQIKFTDVVREFARRINDDDLKWLNARFSQRLGGDIASALEVVERHPDLNRALGAAANSNDLYDMVDQADQAIQKEYNRRFVSHEPKPRERAYQA